MIKKIFILLPVVMLLFITGCTSQKKSDSSMEKVKNNAYASISPQDIMTIETVAEINGNPSDSTELYSLSTEVALVKIESIDGGDNLTQETKEYIYPFTYGKMSVQEVYKGSMTVGSTVGYVRMGGIIPFDNYYQSLFPEQKSKLDSKMGTEKPEYVQATFEDDIQIEVGKTYVVYLKTYTDYVVEGLPMYSVIGWQGGLRKAEGNSKARSGMRIYNNFTGQWETLGQVIPAK